MPETAAREDAGKRTGLSAGQKAEMTGLFAIFMVMLAAVTAIAAAAS